MAKEFPKGGFKIIKDSIVTGTGNGYQYCDTEPSHPYATKLKDRNRKYIYVHRVVMENHLGRFLEDDEHIDHKDDNPSNNALSNLKLMDKSSHPRMHMKENKPWLDSPRTKPGRKRKHAFNVVAGYLNNVLNGY